MIYEFSGAKPQIDEDVFVADDAAIIGDVTVKSGASIWFGAVLRGDQAHIEIGEMSNVQDNATVHANATLGRGVTVGHNAIIHGCTIGDNTLIGMGAIVLDGAEIGKNCIVGAGALVTGGKKFPDGSLIVGAPATVKRELSREQITSIKENADEYVELSRKYRGL